VLERLAGGKGRAERAIGHFIEPMACLAVAEVPAGPEWEYEVKFDGYRAIGFKTRGRVHLMSRNGKDFSQRFRTLARALEALPDDAVVDGELVALDTAGRQSFNLLQNYASSEYHLVFYLFDLLVFAGADLTREPLAVREVLQDNLMRRLSEPVRFSETLRARRRSLFEQCVSRAWRVRSPNARIAPMNPEGDQARGGRCG
jgi:bifunctional non-homologous end joining protein LigD